MRFIVRRTFFAIISVSSKPSYDLLPMHIQNSSLYTLLTAAFKV